MPPFVLTVLKITLLLMLYFFVWRAVRTIAADLYGRGPARQPRQAQPRSRPARKGRGGKPSRVVVLDQKGGRGDQHRLNGTLTIGRGPDVDIPLEDTYASQQHARISERNGTWVVEDLGSTNGTYLNQRKVTVPTQLSPGDRIRIGNTYLEVRK